MKIVNKPGTREANNKEETKPEIETLRRKKERMGNIERKHHTPYTVDNTEQMKRNGREEEKWTGRGGKRGGEEEAEDTRSERNYTCRWRCR